MMYWKAMTNSSKWRGTWTTPWKVLGNWELKESKKNKEDQADHMPQQPNTIQTHKMKHTHCGLTIKDMINNSLRNNTFDGSWKESIILPLQKKIYQDRSLSNKRPANNLPYVSKYIKYVMLDQLNKHTDNNNLIQSTVCVYKENYSTEPLLIKAVYDIKMALDTEKVNALIATDQSVAFNTVNH